ncbi:uncharacterized protein RHO17_021803 [Thomomys bottae]
MSPRKDDGRCPRPGAPAPPAKVAANGEPGRARPAGALRRRAPPSPGVLQIAVSGRASGRQGLARGDSDSDLPACGWGRVASGSGSWRAPGCPPSAAHHQDRIPVSSLEPLLNHRSGSLLPQGTLVPESFSKSPRLEVLCASECAARKITTGEGLASAEILTRKKCHPLPCSSPATLTPNAAPGIRCFGAFAPHPQPDDSRHPTPGLPHTLGGLRVKLELCSNSRPHQEQLYWEIPSFQSTRTCHLEFFSWNWRKTKNAQHIPSDSIRNLLIRKAKVDLALYLENLCI